MPKLEIVDLTDELSELVSIYREHMRACGQFNQDGEHFSFVSPELIASAHAIEIAFWDSVCRVADIDMLEEINSGTRLEGKMVLFGDDAEGSHILSVKHNSTLVCSGIVPVSVDSSTETRIRRDLYGRFKDRVNAAILWLQEHMDANGVVNIKTTVTSVDLVVIHEMEDYVDDLVSDDEDEQEWGEDVEEFDDEIYFAADDPRPFDGECDCEYCEASKTIRIPFADPPPSGFDGRWN